jgi:hypothetical protein
MSTDDYFFLDPNDPVSWDEYEFFTLRDEAIFSPPLHRLRRSRYFGYPTFKQYHFKDVRLDEESGVRYSWGCKWHEDFPTDNNPDNRLPGLIYKVNSENMHGEEFHHSPDILALGCSVSSGIGLAHDFSWPYIIGHVYGKTVNNLSTPGESAAFMVYAAMDHIRKFGIPKSIYFLVPPLDRYTGPLPDPEDKSKKNSRDWVSGKISYAMANNYYLDAYGKRYSYISIDKHKSIVPLDLIANFNLSMIEMLAMFCDSVGSELRLSSWDRHTHKTLRIIDYPEVVDLPFFLLKPNSLRSNIEYTKSERLISNWGYPTELCPIGLRRDCCDKEPLNEWQDAMWDYGLDIKWDRFYPHPGLHMQLHLAEILTGEQILTSDYETLNPWHVGTKFEPNDLDDVYRPDREQ